MKRLLFYMIGCMGIGMFLAGPVYAVVNGPCSVCHTMHNSQNALNFDDDGPYRHLTKGDCIGCHSGTNSGGGTSTGAIPFVMTTGGGMPTYGTDTLAGGNFWWVADSGGDDDAKGHNVWGLSGQDAAISQAPGGGGCGATACHTTLAVEQTVIGDLGSGCEGCHVHVAHHKSGSDTPDITDGEDGWFRFCSEAHDMGGGINRGVEGIEDDDWQYQTSATDHNEYLGVVGNHEASGGFGTGNTMSAYCCGCHGNFHVESDGAAWIRHPSDAVLPADGEYAEYTVYAPLAPVARPDLTAIGDTGVVRPGTDMVMCLSCHRAHGSPYDDMLRWDYVAGTLAGGGGSADGSGCFECHTEKDD